ncbi:site-specific DNA-methyltransferase [Flavobacterium psychrophilum]|uniref:site-specific DNA-methyltransferase (adenine-specific) n=1 Tax=Flavobacterium psychrophilum TaxID=96345 RepID=A0A7U2NDP9_FLAPS|nr:site-specific DNA-methyltransferase [Flavobacterium psychrophilum]QRE03286.1 site-specific DNA-methyltransferase [Flavobacterium psychrophilum]
MSDKLDMTSPDLVSQNIEKIAALFPNCVTESANGLAIDFDMLKQELSNDIVEGNKERYRLEWPGKREAIVTANLPINKTLRPAREESVDFDNTENLYIEGDNLEVLKLLQESYLGKIKMIYIDPPYNTGKDFVYKDNFTQDTDEYQEEAGLKDEYSNRLVANPDTSGRYHSDWLTMMYPRLKLARNLLTDDGVIFISIDDNEVHNLRKISDEVFGDDNFVIEIAWRKSDNQANIGNIARVKEYILCYTKRKDLLNLNKIPLTDKAKKEYSYKDSEGYFRRAILLDKTRGRHYYDVTTKNGKTLNGPWMIKEGEFLEKDRNNEILWTNSGDEQPYGKIYLHKSTGQIANDFWDTTFGSNQEASINLEKIFENRIFDFPKSTKLLKNIVTIGSDKSSLILDFFSGSASTAHSVMQLNTEDGGNRKFIMVQVPERTDEKSEAFKAGYDTICEIGKERIRRAGNSIIENQKALIKQKQEELQKIEAKNDLIKDEEKIELLQSEINALQFSIDNLDKGFRVYKIDSSNMQDVYYTPNQYEQGQLDLLEDNIKPDRNSDDLVAQIMLDWGLPLSLKIEQTKIANKEVFKVADDALLCCFDEGIDEAFAKEIATLKPLRIVFRDKSFKDDTAKENVKQLLKQLSPDSEMKVI